VLWYLRPRLRHTPSAGAYMCMQTGTRRGAAAASRSHAHATAPCPPVHEQIKGAKTGCSACFPCCALPSSVLFTPVRRRVEQSSTGHRHRVVVAFQSLPRSPSLLRFLHPYFTQVTSCAPVSCTRMARHPHRAAVGPQATPTATDKLRTTSTPLEPKNRTLGEPLSLPTTSPVHPGDELSPSAGAPGDYIASLRLCLGSFLQSRDPSVISETSVKGLLVNVSLGFQLNLRKFIKNRRNIRKMQI
jgi:hypothetical protein